MSSLYTIAFYNTENLFDTSNDKKLLDDDFSPKGRRKWTQKRYDNKIMKLSTAISKIGLDETFHPPSIVGLAEIENSRVIEDLIDNENLGKDIYAYVHYDSTDERGMDVGLIYNKNVFSVEHSQVLHPPMIYNGDGRDQTRDVLYIKGKLAEQLIHIFVVHMPSRREENVNSPKRHVIAEKLSLHVKEIQDREENPNIVILGDFNADPTADSIKKFFHTEPHRNIKDKYSFHNPMEDLENKGHFTNLHQKNKLLFDQMLFSYGFFTNETKIDLVETHVFNPFFLQEWDKKYEGQPFRTYVGSKYLGGYSDHFPIYSILKI